MQVNFDKGKTEAMVVYRGKNATKVKEEISGCLGALAIAAPPAARAGEAGPSSDSAASPSSDSAAGGEWSTSTLGRVLRTGVHTPTSHENVNSRPNAAFESRARDAQRGPWFASEDSGGPSEALVHGELLER